MDEFDAIVVGAGPAGCAAAYTMAKAGLNILVLERGQYAGAKNMWGGAFFGPVMEDLFPNFWQEAPVERYVHRHVISFLTKEDALSIDYRSSHYASCPKRGFITLRAKFDRWMAQKVEEAGAIVATGLCVDDLIVEDNIIKGVRVGDEAFYSNVVVISEGVNALLTKKIGLRKEHLPCDMKQGVKEVIRLSKETVEERFNLEGVEGVAMEFVGDCTQGLPGGGFLYTNRDSVSLGVVVQLSALLENKIKASELIERFKSHPVIRGFIRNGVTVEYSAHMIPVAGLKMMPPVYTDGILVTGDAAALVLGTGLILEGANFAMASGVAAGKAVIRAHEKKDFSRNCLSSYMDELKDQFVLKDLETFENAPVFLENDRIYRTYPEWACGLSRTIFQNDGTPRSRTFKVMMDSMKGKLSIWQLLSDAVKARKAI